MNPPIFIPGLELGRLFYAEAVRPILDDAFPNLPHTAALIGSGSEILGFDDAMSRDHHWGPRVMLFLRPADLPARNAIRDTLANRLPHHFRGYPTNFSAPNPDDSNVQLLIDTNEGPVNHRVEIATLSGFLLDYLGIDPSAGLTVPDWLTIPQQKLATLRAGAVFHDDLGLESTRSLLRWYPRDVWLYLMAASWTRIGQEEHLMGRAGMRGDEIGSALIGARLVRDGMRLAFLMERQYAPYPKWFGSAFERLDCAPQLSPHFRRALLSETWVEREQHLVAAYEQLARMHNQLSVTDPLPETVTDFWGRPFRVMAFHGFADRLLEQIQDAGVKKLPIIGNIDLVSDNTDFVYNFSAREKIKTLYE